MPLWLHFKQKQVGKGRERVKIKIIITFRSYPTRNSKFQQNSNKIQKIKKILLWLHLKPKQVVKCREREKIKIPSCHYGILSSQNRLEKAEKKRKYKLSFRFIPTRCERENYKEIVKKLKKYPYGFISSQKQVGKGGEREKIKIIVTFNSYQTCN